MIYNNISVINSNTMNSKYKKKDLGCQIHAFCGAFFGYSQITTLTCKL